MAVASPAWNAGYLCDGLKNLLV